MPRQILWRVIGSRVLWLSVFLALVAGLFHYFRAEQPLRCLFKTYTGVACPGCGSMRVAYALMEGRFADALRINLLSVTAYVLLVMMLAVRFWDEVCRTQYYQQLFRRQIPLVYILLLLGFVLLYWYVWIIPRL